jgi:hypothetical protein
MEIEYTDAYLEHGCDIRGNLGVIRYSKQTTNHEFLGAYKRGGLFEWLEKAKELAKSKHPSMTVKLGIPDLVFTFDCDIDALKNAE